MWSHRASLLRNLLPDSSGLDHRKEPAPGAGALGQGLAALRASRRRRASWRKASLRSPLFPRPSPHLIAPQAWRGGFSEPTVRDSPSASEGPGAPWFRPSKTAVAPAAESGGFDIINLETRVDFITINAGSRFRFCLRASLGEHSGIRPRGHPPPSAPARGPPGPPGSPAARRSPQGARSSALPPARSVPGTPPGTRGRPAGSRGPWHGRRVIGERRGPPGGGGGHIPRGAGPRHSPGGGSGDPDAHPGGPRGHGTPLPRSAPRRALPAAPPAH